MAMNDASHTAVTPCGIRQEAPSISALLMTVVVLVCDQQHACCGRPAALRHPPDPAGPVPLHGINTAVKTGGLLGDDGEA